jgi:2-succinyl-5-enolpyruvyl-6-hydroxy-3-cyclohexene-1-carboxylate synthase
MTVPNPSTLWAQIFVEELARAGLRHVCIAPGSRSTPLTTAFAGHPAMTVYSLLDERGASFFALGLALAEGQPAALVCTSGTAAANFHPAVIEAFYAQVPLLVLTTDRPPELRHSGANQTVDQVKLYGDHVRWFVDVGLPENEPADLTLRALRTLACRALAVAAGSPPGPVHLNFPFRKPLEPTPLAGARLEPQAATSWQGRSDRQPFTRLSRGQLNPTPDQIELLAGSIRQARHGLIVCGPRCPGGDFPRAVTRLARLAGYPILADALSGLRFGPQTRLAEGLICGAYETYLQPDQLAGWQPPELMVRIGAMPISANLGALLAQQSACRQIAIDGSGIWQDETHTLSHLVWADPAITCHRVAAQLEAAPPAARDEHWPARFAQAEKKARQTFEQKLSETFFEGALLAEVVDMLPPESLLVVASSLPVRHLDQFAGPQPKPLRVLANRGASGIDGTIATALGAAAVAGQPLVLVCGDVAFYHDLNSLLALRRCGVKATLVLINNNGGGIFQRLPMAQFDPPFTELFVTPHDLRFEPVARMFGAAYAAVDTLVDFRREFQRSITAQDSRLIEVLTDAVFHEKIRKEIMHDAVDPGQSL